MSFDNIFSLYEDGGKTKLSEKATKELLAAIKPLQRVVNKYADKKIGILDTETREAICDYIFYSL